MSLKNVKFIRSCADSSNYLDESKKEIIILGKSNVGKSTFINLLTGNSTLAKTSSTPGRTRLLNFFDCENFRIVDAPGYGYSIISKRMDLDFSNMMEEYFQLRKNIAGAILLIDSRRAGSEEDKEMLDYIVHYNIPFFIVATKTDKLNQSERTKLDKTIISKLDLSNVTTIYKSSTTNSKWIDEVIDRMNYMVK